MTLGLGGTSPGLGGGRELGAWRSSQPAATPRRGDLAGRRSRRVYTTLADDDALIAFRVDVDGQRRSHSPDPDHRHRCVIGRCLYPEGMCKTIHVAPPPSPLARPRVADLAARRKGHANWPGGQFALRPLTADGKVGWWGAGERRRRGSKAPEPETKHVKYGLQGPGQRSKEPGPKAPRPSSIGEPSWPSDGRYPIQHCSPGGMVPASSKRAVRRWPAVRLRWGKGDGSPAGVAAAEVGRPGQEARGRAMRLTASARSSCAGWVYNSSVCRRWWPSTSCVMRGLPQALVSWVANRWRIE